MGSVNGEDAIDASGKAASPDRIILVVCPTHRDYRELPRLSHPGIGYIFHDYASTSLEDLVSNPHRAKDLAADPLDEIEAILAKVRGLKLAGVITSDDYPGSALDAAVAARRAPPRLPPTPARNGSAFPAPTPPWSCFASTNIWRGWNKRDTCRRRSPLSP